MLQPNESEKTGVSGANAIVSGRDLPRRFLVTVWGHSLIRITSARKPKQMRPTRLRQQWFIYASLLTPVRVHSLRRPVDVTVTLGVVERIGGSSARDNIKGNASRQRVTGGADLTTKPAQLTGMRKGSVRVRGVAPKG